MRREIASATSDKYRAYSHEEMYGEIGGDGVCIFHVYSKRDPIGWLVGESCTR